MKPEKDNLHERICKALQDPGDAPLAAVLSEAKAPDIAETFDLLADEERSRIVYALSPHTAAEVVVMLGDAVRSDVVEDLDTESLTELVSKLPPDDAADVLGDLSEKEAEGILDQMRAEQSDKIEELLEYEETEAGGIMTPDVVAVPASATVADAVEKVRQATQVEELHEIYIVDDDRKLLGTVPLRRLVTNALTTKVANLSDPDCVTVYAHEDQETVVQVIRKYDALEAAVVDERGCLLGRITHDDLLDVAEEEAAEDMYRMAGTDPTELETSSVFRAARVRLTWLLPCMLGMLVTASVLALSERLFNAVLFASLLLFVPMIGAIGGNSGIQISTVIVRGFATGELGSTLFVRALMREGRIALVMATVCGIVAWGLVSASWPLLQTLGVELENLPNPERLAVSVGAAMTTAILVASFLGIALPFTFRRLGVDPAIAAGPLVTTVNDIVSVAIYMTLAMWITR